MSGIQLMTVLYLTVIGWASWGIAQLIADIIDEWSNN